MVGRLRAPPAIIVFWARAIAKLTVEGPGTVVSLLLCSAVFFLNIQQHTTRTHSLPVVVTVIGQAVPPFFSTYLTLESRAVKEGLLWKHGRKVKGVQPTSK